VCNLEVTSVTISCNPDGTVHWVATVVNYCSEPATFPYKSQLQINIPGGPGGWSGVDTERGTYTFQPGANTLSGDYCFVFPPDTQRIRSEFSIDSTNRECSPRRKSQTMEPCAGTPTCDLGFTDMTSSSTFYTYVMSLADAGAVSGYTDGTFRPDALTTRAQLAKIVVLAFGVQASVADGQGHFSDVTATNPFFQYVQSAYAAGLISGYADGTFRPYANVTRGQVAKVVVSAAGLKLQSPATPSFTDVGVGSTYYQYVETAKANGLLAGYPDGTFRPSAEATRGQIAKIALLGYLAAHPLE
jgi:hypothetical protein